MRPDRLQDGCANRCHQGGFGDDGGIKDGDSDGREGGAGKSKEGLEERPQPAMGRAHVTQEGNVGAVGEAMGKTAETKGPAAWGKGGNEDDAEQEEPYKGRLLTIIAHHHPSVPPQGGRRRGL